MQNINDYNFLKDKIINGYAELKRLGLLPVKAFDAVIDEAAIDEASRNLAEDKFVLSVCGQIKAGKSLLLNDMVFGAELLPTADTPETAKITEISYADKPSYTAYFYSPEEWEALKNSVVEKNGERLSYYEAAIAPALAEALRCGGTQIDEAAVIAQKTAAGSDLTELREYISVKGSFTPLVKAVRIKYPADILKKMTIVDTPGINDPNALRSMITEKWINRSDAVVFLLSAAQPFTMEDKLFFDRYLLSVPPSKIIAAVSKIDLADEAASIKDFVAGALVKALGKNGEKIVEKEKLCLIAPMFTFFKKLKSLAAASRIKLSPERAAEIEYQLSERPRNSAFLKDIIANDGYMQKFLDSLETHLVASRASLLESHIKKIDAVFQYHLKNHENEKAAIEAEIISLKNRAESLAAENEKTAAERNALSALREEITAELNKLGGFFNQRVEEISSGAADKIIKTVIASKPLNELTANLAFESFSIIETGFRELNARFDEYIDKFKAGILALAPKISETDMETGVLFKNSAGQVFNKIDAVKVLNEIKKIVNAAAGAQALSGLTVKWLYFWTDEPKTKARFAETIKRIFTQDLTLQRVILTAGTDAVSAAKTSLGQFFFRFDARISALKKSEEEKSAAIKSAAESAKKLEEEIRSREKAADEILAKKAALMDNLK